MPSAGSAVESWAGRALVVVGVAVVVAHCRLLRVPLVDDAAISLSYAQTLYSGRGLRLTPASQVVEAFSNPLWTFLIGLAYPLRADPIAFTQALGVAFAALSIPTFAAWGPAASGGPLRIEDALGPALAALVSPFAY